MTDDRYDRTTYDGKTLDKYTLAAIHECERRLGYPLTIVQGSYHGGVSASAGTHDGGGAVDLLPWDWQNKVHVLRAVGFAAWHRPTIPGLWNEHIHCILIGNTKASPAAKAQVTDYFNHKDGLADHAADNTWHPDPIPTFAYPGTVTPPSPRRTRFVADYSTARPDPKVLAAAGFRGVMRYVSPPGGTKKDLTVNEAKALHAAGLWIALVFESTAGRAGEGSAAGAFDVATAEAAADKLGYPADACIFYAVDFDASPAAVSAYFTGVHDAAKRPVGIYGGVKVIDARLASHGWQTEAWSGGKVSKHAVMLQHIKPTLKIPAGTDENMLLKRRGFRVWKPDATPPPPPPPVHHHKRLGRRFGTHNIKSFPPMPASVVAADVARTLDLLDVALLQEIDPARSYYGTTVTEIAAAQGFEVDHLDTEDPILWRTEHRARVGGGKQMTHAGKAKVSPNRYVTWTIFDDDTVAVNSHMISKAFWSPKHGAKPTSYRWRRKMWKLHVQVMSQVIADLVNQGYTVLLGGDWNHAGVPRFHADQQTILEGGLDGLAYVPAVDGPSVEVVKDEVVRDGWRTDHPLMRAWLKVTA